MDEKTVTFTGDDMICGVRQCITQAKGDVVKFLLHDLLETCLDPKVAADKYQAEEPKKDFMAYIGYIGDRLTAYLMGYGSSYTEFSEEKRMLREEINDFLDNAECLYTVTVKSKSAQDLIKEFKDFLNPDQ